MKKLFTQFVLIFAVIFSLLSTGCPSKTEVAKTVRDFKVKSAELSVYGGKLVTAFGDAYKAGEITREQLATLNVGTNKFVVAVGIYRAAIAEVETIVRDGKTWPTGTLDRLQLILNDGVIGTFLDILVRLGTLSIAKSEIVKTTLTAIRITLLAISGAFGNARDLMNQPEIIVAA